MNVNELVTFVISEYLNIEVQRETGNLEFDSKLEIINNRITDRLRNKVRDDRVPYNPGKYEYEMLFTSNPNDEIKVDGWVPVETSKIQKADKINEYVKLGLLRKINPLSII